MRQKQSDLNTSLCAGLSPNNLAVPACMEGSDAQPRYFPVAIIIAPPTESSSRLTPSYGHQSTHTLSPLKPLPTALLACSLPRLPSHHFATMHARVNLASPPLQPACMCMFTTLYCHCCQCRCTPLTLIPRGCAGTCSHNHHYECIHRCQQTAQPPSPLLWLFIWTLVSMPAPAPCLHCHCLHCNKHV